MLKAALGRAVRFPTVAELYGATSTTNSQFINDPNLRPERSWTGELSAEKDLGNASLRATAEAGDNCGDGGIYVRPDRHLDWIKSVVAAHGLTW